MAQQEYWLAWTLVGLFFLLALLVVCIPRPRAVDLKPVDRRAKVAAKRKKAGEKIKQQRLKQKAKKK